MHQALERIAASGGAHIRMLQARFASLNRTIGGVRGNLSAFLPMLAGLGAGGSLVGMFAMVKGAADSALAGQALMAKMQVSGKDFGGLTFAAKMTGVDPDAMGKGIIKFNKVLGEVAVGKGKEAAAIFKHLGISVQSLKGKSAADMMLVLADAVAKTKDPALQAYLATTMFGKAGADLLPILRLGRDGLADLEAAGGRLAVDLPEAQGAALKQFSRNWTEAEMAMSGFKKMISGELAPIFAPIVADMRDWVLENRAWIATAITAKVKALAAAFKQIDWKGLIKSATEWVKWTVELIEKHGGLKTILGAVVLLMGSPLLAAISGAITAFIALGDVLVGVGAILWANPILAAVGAVALAAFLLYKNWDWVKTKMTVVFDWFSNQGPVVQALLLAFMPFLFFPMKIYANWQPIEGFFVTLWDKITAAFDRAWAQIKVIVDNIRGAVSWVENSWVGKGLAAQLDAGAAAGKFVGNTAVNAFNMFTAPETPPPGLYGPNANPAAPPQNGEVRVKVDFTNAPLGTRVTTSASGIAQPPDTDLGFAAPAFAGF
jgi:hypothetical protein